MTQQGVQQFRLPDVGEGLVEAEILSWNVRPGDEITVNQIICEIETVKAVVELPSPFAGTVREVLVEAGTTVDVGTPIISVDTGGGGPEPAAEEEAEDEGRQPVLVGYGAKAGATRRRPRRRPGAAPDGPGGAAPNGAAGPRATPAEAAAAPPPRPASGGPAGRPTVLAKPPVRKLAKDLGVDLHTVTPTGPGGTVTREDVQRRHGAAAEPSAAAAPEAAPVPAAAPDRAAREERIPIRGVRKHTAAAMVGSAFTAPHVTEFLQVDVTKTMKAVRRLRERPEFAGLKVSPLLLVARALLTAIRRHPGINATWDEDAQEIVVKHYVNLGIAAATDRGLVVPNVKDADRLPLPDLARALQELAETARAGRTTPAAMAGGTITITNVGVFGVDSGTPILNPGEAAILAVGQIRDMPWVHKGQLKVRKVTTLGLSFDHRLVDGELGSKALRDIGAWLTDPEATALAWG
ncbi:dihydrolipoamide acetyltransferase family protein [Marinitenerispora sediminis]|uniref:Dihydrolipoamide acetyltransferase component of pyruvate dehydrogenase complex n=1 Tax=Marinitenerispora sediminis TaxID=1931232 RepID=A0A368TAL9_9ACTN|nr:dihydrolipoamide acetyltransferase family protein [Marinitenerispora sediminis]RCV50796.1 branched-chain alpha-keto acid dehydrogenase subunit E2 [Marinitenerispora sediminis]RCV55027.1 branched-chain alpha-keto acid dehydrogenase subunit E2 [Marinitenerispora sediminis]RCV62066.1 branched-chain alpha-keto acid dehydrogenase subunit E2 [Marinitenerispora sediminis]